MADRMATIVDLDQIAPLEQFYQDLHGMSETLG